MNATLARTILTNAELEESINILLDDDSVENLSNNLVATNSTLVLLVLALLQPSVAIGTSQLATEERYRLSVGNRGKDSGNRSNSNSDVDEASVAETETDKATNTKYYSIPKPSREFELFLLESAVIDYLKAYSRRHGVV